LTALSDVVLFSAALPYQGGTDHINEQWAEFWAILFQRHGYVPVDLLRRQFWKEQAVEFWYSQNLIIFCTVDFASKNFPSESLATGRPLSYPHPLTFLVNVARYRPLSASVLDLECEDYQHVLHAYQRGDGTLPLMRMADATNEAGSPLFPVSRTLIVDARAELAARDAEVERLAGELESARSEAAGKAWLEEQVRNWQQLAEQRQEVLVAYEAGKAWLEGQARNWQQLAEQRQEVLVAYEAGKAWLEGQVRNWQRLAEQRQEALVAYEAGKAWLEEQVRNWQRVAEEQQQRIAELLSRKLALEGQLEDLARLEQERFRWQEIASEAQESLATLESRANNLSAELEGWRQSAEERGGRIAELEKAKTWLAQQVENWRAVAGQRSERIAALEETIARMRATRVWRAADWSVGVLRRLSGIRRSFTG
jgi:hypothetical protein